MNDVTRPAWHTMETEDVFAWLETVRGGLDSVTAGQRLRLYGPNRIRESEGVDAARILLHQFAGALMYVLLGAMAISLAIGHWGDAIVIAVVLVVNATVGFFQEYRAENAIAALMGLVAPRARARRDERTEEVPGESLVPGDVVCLQSGDVVPADLRLFAARALEIDEALLTGESVPVSKTSRRLDLGGVVPVAERHNMTFMGSAVASGRGEGVVVATGSHTEMGAIARQIRSSRRAPTPLQERMARFGRRISVAILALSALAFGVGLLRGEAPAQMFLTAVAIAVSAVPEGLPVVMTVALAVSVRRMARRHAIVRRLPAVETLGSCTVIVTDKTGTLTQNRMTVQEVWSGGSRYGVGGTGPEGGGRFSRDGDEIAVAPDSPLAWTLMAGMLCSEADLQQGEAGRVRGLGDPTELALLVAGGLAGLERDEVLGALPRVDMLPFESERRYAASLHRSEGLSWAFVKGAPEQILEMSRDQLGQGGTEPLAREALLAEAGRMAAEGQRVLGIARTSGRTAEQALRARPPRQLTFLGLVALRDPPRPEVSAAIEACQGAGIRVVMVTGDHAQTAVAIAAEIGLAAPVREPPSGARLAAMSDEELVAALEEHSIFARVAPADKLRIVRSLIGSGHVVAVTGDGVNDAPALKAAHVGAAMGLSGSDVAKEASEIVLADDNFATIGAAVEEGRTAFSNLRKATLFLVSSGVGELLAILGSLALRLPLPLLPVQILWLNVVTNGVEDVALAFEGPEPGQFRRPPRPPREGVLSRLLLERLVLSGVVMALGTLGVFLVEWGGDPERVAYARVAALTCLVLFQVFHVGNCRSEGRSAFATSPFSNRFLLLGVVGSALLHLTALHLPLTQRLLALEPLAWETWLRLLMVSVTIVAVVEVHKLLRRAPAQ